MLTVSVKYNIDSGARAIEMTEDIFAKTFCQVTECCALDRWMLTCSDLTQLVDEIRNHARRSKSKPTQTVKEVGPQRLHRDEGDLKKIQR